MRRRPTGYISRPPALWRWEWIPVMGAGIFLLFIISLWTKAYSFRTETMAQIGIGLALLLLAAVAYGTKRYILAGILSVTAGFLTFRLWMTTDVYAFVRRPGTLHFCGISLLVALAAMGGVMLFSFFHSRRLASPKAPVSVTTILCVGVLLFGQCEVALTHLNVAWDRSEPVTHVCVVEGNWEERYGRRATTTSLLLDKDGEKIMFNRSSNGVEYLPGDIVIVQEYTGAFGEPYYLLKGEL